ILVFMNSTPSNLFPNQTRGCARRRQPSALRFVEEGRGLQRCPAGAAASGGAKRGGAGGARRGAGEGGRRGAAGAARRGAAKCGSAGAERTIGTLSRGGEASGARRTAGGATRG